MPLPTRTVYETYTNPATQQPATGRIVLTPLPRVWTDTSGGQILAGGGTFEVVAGAVSRALTPTDVAGMEPATGKYWEYEERLDGLPYRRRIFELPTGDGSPAAIRSLIDADPAAAGYVRGPQGEQGPEGPAGATGVTGPQGIPGVGDRPEEQNLLTWTYDPSMAGHVTAQSVGGVAGRITLVRIILRSPITWSNVWIGLAGVDAAAVLSNCYLGVYDTTGTLRASTADISSSLMTGATAKALPLTVPFAAAAGTYFIAMVLNGSWATNVLTFKSSGAGISVNAGLVAPNLRYSTLLTGQTSLPSSINLATQSTSTINTGWASQWYGVS
jgi:hypothetical protein